MDAHYIHAFFDKNSVFPPRLNIHKGVTANALIWNRHQYQTAPIENLETGNIGPNVPGNREKGTPYQILFYLKVKSAWRFLG